MKHWSARKTIWVALVSVVFVFAAPVPWLLSKPATHDCAAERSTDPQKIHATKVVVQPWIGRHQVFGIFMVPLLYRSGRNYSGRISVVSFNDEFIPDWHQIQWVEDVIVEPGYYLVQRYLPTRIALWFMFTGQFGDLQDPCNWTIEFVKRIP